MGRLLIVLSLIGVSCGPPVPADRPILAWRLVEVDAAGGKELILEPDRSGFARVEIRLFRERAGVGEEVEAEIRLPEGTGRHRIEVAPDRPGVRILGPREFDVEGAQAARVRFTCELAGRGGILVVVRE